MNIRRLVAGSMAAALLLVGGGMLANNASAGAVYISQENGSAVVDKATKVDGSAYLAGNTVTVDGTVDGDVYCAGNDTVINGTVEGDVLCGGNTLTVNGTVHGDVRLAGNVVTINGTVHGGASVAASELRIGKDGRVARDVTGGTSITVIDGTIGRDMLAGVEKLTMNGAVERNVNASLSQVSFGSNAKIGGNFTYESRSEHTVPAGVVAGDVAFTQIANKSSASNAAMMLLTTLLVALLSVGILVLVATLAAPRLMHAVSSDASWSRIGLALLIGFVFMIVAPLAAILFALTGVGIAVAGVLVVLWLLLMLLSSVPVAQLIGAKLVGKRTDSIMTRGMAGVGVIALLMLVPVVNIMAMTLIIALGSGLFVLHFRHQYGRDAYTAPAPQPKDGAPVVKLAKKSTKPSKKGDA